MRSFGSSLRSTLARRAMPLLLAVASTACGDSSNGPSAPAGPASAPAGAPSGVPSVDGGFALTPVPLRTYEGSGQSVHPDAATTPFGWSAVTTHIVATPYPNGNPRVENPSYYDVLDPWTWNAPDGVVNPIAVPGVNAHLSDPDMLYDPDTHALWVYYREVTDSNLIHVIRSTDGMHWTDPATVVAVPNHSAVSPTVVRRGPGDWLMWVVNAGTDGCSAIATNVELRHSTDGLTWSAPDWVRIGRGRETPWHIDVEWIASRHEYWAVYNAKRSGTCTTQVVRFASSPDGVNWTEYPSPLLHSGAISEFADVVYRASIAYDSASDMVTLLYSGARQSNGAYAWQMASERITLRALMARITAPAPASSHELMPGARTVPDLTNETAP